VSAPTPHRDLVDAILDARPVAAVLDFGIIRTGLIANWFMHLYIGVDGAVRGVGLAPIPLLAVLVTTGALAVTFRADPTVKPLQDA
jgi:hypothetical protein